MKYFAYQANNQTSTNCNNILTYFIQEIRHFRSRYNKKPDYIIISPSDYEAILKEMYNIGILPNRKKGGEFSFSDVPIIQSLNFNSGQFDIVGR